MSKFNKMENKLKEKLSHAILNTPPMGRYIDLGKVREFTKSKEGEKYTVQELINIIMGDNSNNLK